MQSGFMSGGSTTGAIFIMTVAGNLLFKKQDLKIAFDRSRCKLLWQAMRKLGVDKLISQLGQAMYCEVRSKACSENCLGFSVNIGIYWGFLPSPEFFIMVLEMLSQKLKPNDFAESVEQLRQKLTTQKVNLDNKYLRLNVKKTKS